MGANSISDYYGTRLYTDLYGIDYNYLTVVKDLGYSLGKRRRHLLCKCICGKEVPVLNDSLFRGTIKSCGCMQRIRFHKMSGTRFYLIWANMLTRCNGRGKSPSQIRYLKKGITVCKRWEKFDNFYADMYEGYKENLTLDRKNNKLGYYKENCRWRTPKQQALNRDNTIYLTLNNVTKRLVEWADELGVNPYTLKVRHHRKWTDEKILLTPIGGLRGKHKKINKNGLK